MGCYSEPYFPEADVADLRQGFGGANWQATVFGILQRRWPSGHELLQDMRADPDMPRFADTGSFGDLMASIDTIVHEETHGWDFEHADWGRGTFSFFLRRDLIFEPPYLDGVSPAPVVGLLADDSCNLYLDYLTRGDAELTYPLLEELNAYINGLAAVAAVGEFVPYGFSARDGAVAFLHFLQLYLGFVQRSHPALYAELQAEPVLVEMVRTQWLRAHFFLEQADRYENLGVHDGRIRRLLHAPDNLQAISDFTGTQLGDSCCPLGGAAP